MGGWWVESVLHNQGPVALASWIFWVLFSITLHELAHGWTALRQGDTTPRDLQRLTLNPVVHMGPFSLIMFAICGIAWGVMPVDPYRFRDGTRGEVQVAAAGPAMNLSLAVVALGLGAVVTWILGPSDTAREIKLFFYYGLFLNLLLCLFNLLPVIPLDGSRILAAVWMPFRRLTMHENAHLFGLGVLALIVFTPIGGTIVGLIAVVANTTFDAACRW